MVFGKPAVESRPRTSMLSSPDSRGAAEPTVNLISSAVRSPINRP